MGRTFLVSKPQGTLSLTTEIQVGIEIVFSHSPCFPYLKHSKTSPTTTASSTTLLLHFRDPVSKSPFSSTKEGHPGSGAKISDNNDQDTTENQLRARAPKATIIKTKHNHDMYIMHPVSSACRTSFEHRSSSSSMNKATNLLWSASDLDQVRQVLSSHTKMHNTKFTALHVNTQTHQDDSHTNSLEFRHAQASFKPKPCGQLDTYIPDYLQSGISPCGEVQGRRGHALGDCRHDASPGGLMPDAAQGAQ
ncbi:hypothetical protein ACHAQJ_007532 [Trichoderma viride]